MINFQSSDLFIVLPEIVLLSLACVVLLLDLFVPRHLRRVTEVATLLAIFITLLTVLLSSDKYVRFAFSDMYVADPLSDFLKVCASLAVSVILVYSARYLPSRSFFKGEFYILILFSLLGMMVMISGNHLLVLYLGLELLSLSLYSLVALSNKDDKASEAAIKYFILGAVASGLLLYGMSMLYGATGTLLLSEMALGLDVEETRLNMALLGIVFVVAGIAFKVGAVPFHMWVPDVYQGAPTPITLLIGSAPKLAAFAFIFRLLVEGAGTGRLLMEWQQMFLILAVLSIALGNIVAIAQTNIKRMLAYSTMAHMGFMLLGFAAGQIQGFGAAMFYTVTYVLMALGCFGVILYLSRKDYDVESIEDFKGLSRRNPWYAFIMLLFMFSMAGIPPMLGFWAKLSILQSVVSAGYLGIAVFSVIMSLVGAFYYLRVIKLMYFDGSGLIDSNKQSLGSGIILSLNGLMVIIIGLFPGLLLAFCEKIVLASI